MYNNLLSKKSKKAISALLASALVISAAPTSVAEAAVTKTFTLGVGKTATKTVSATIKSVKTSKKAVVTVKKVAAKKYKLTAKKAGKATVTVKYGKKTLKATVKVGATKVTKKAFNATMKVNETQKLKINATNGKKDTIQWTTSDANVVAIAKTSTTASAKGNTSVVATAVAAGTAKVTAKSKFTGKKATFTITVAADTAATVAPSTDVTVAPSTDVTVAPSTDVTVAPSADATTAPTATPEIKNGLTARVDNQIPGYDNVVLVNDNAIVTVSVKDDAGNPLANKTVIMSAQKYVSAIGDDFEVKGNTVVTTNEKGEASFVIGHKTSEKIDITSETYIGSAKYTATVVGENKTYSGYVGFAAIIAGDLDWDGDDDKGEVNEDKTDNLVPGANAKATEDYDEYSYSGTTDMNGDNDVQYIGAQQVSSAGTTEHKVTFSVNPQIIIPAMQSDSKDTRTFEQEVNEVSGAYGTYDTKTAKIVLKEDMSQLQYATLNFNSIQLSKYTKMTIQCFSDEECTKGVTLADGTEEYTLEGEADQKGFAYQIPKNNSIKAIKVTITSEGQVQTNRNAGFDIKNITGVYDSKSAAVGEKREALSSAKITWEAVTPSYSEIKVLKNEDARKLGIDAKEDSSFTYQVPVFPYTGNAVIKEYDANGVLVKYHVAPTERKNGDNTTNTNDIILDENYVDKKGYKPYKKAYQVSEEEALTRILDGVTQDGNVVTANSEKVGSTTLQGTITIDGLGSNVLNEATSKVYTSVHWNPIPNADKVDAVAESEAAIALAGQKMTVYAQLTDKNGNVVSLAGEDVTFKADVKDTEVNISKTGKVVSDDAISVIDVTPTDVNGKAKLVVSSAIAEELINVRAEAKGDKYNVVLTVGNATTASNKVDLYWVDANLRFTNSVETKDITPESVTTANDTKNIAAKNPTVGTPWEYGFKTVGDVLDEGILKDYSVAIDGLKIQTVNYEDNKGTYTEVGNGKVSAESIYDNMDKITAKLGADSVGETVTFTATKTDKKDLTIISAGEGTPNINAKINLSVDWDAVGTVVDIMAVEGTSIGDGETTMYIKVTDNNGVNPLVNRKVTVKTNNKGDLFQNGKDEIDVITNSYGIAEVTLTRGAGSESSIITANVENTDQIASKTINWVAAGNEFAALRARMTDTNKVEVTFNNEIYAGSVNANEFELTGKDANGKTVTYSVKDATVSGTKVILTIGETLGAGEYTVAVKEYVKDEVKYNLVDEKGQKVTANDKVNFYSTKTATYDVSATSGSAVINVTNVNSPVVTSEGAIYKKIIVTVNGKVVDYTATQTIEGDVVKAYEFKLEEVLKENDVVRVSYMGAMETVTAK